MIGALCRIEAEIRANSLKGRAKLEYRSRHSLAVVEAFFGWVAQQRQRLDLLPSDPFAKALVYAALFHCSWSTMAAAVDEAVAYGPAHHDLSGVTHIGIGEISRKRGHVYVTNVYDLESRRSLWSGEGRASVAYFSSSRPSSQLPRQAISPQLSHRGIAGAVGVYIIRPYLAGAVGEVGVKIRSRVH
jgi:hypothetical protein